MTVLAIDQGTSGTKAIVVDDDDAVRSIVELPLRPDYRPGGVVEQDPAALMDSVLSAARRACGEANITIDAVALANQGETVLAWDPATGAPLSPLIVWQDSRAQAICDGLSGHADELHDRTGLVLDPYFSAPKLAWLRRNITAQGVVTTSDAWIVHRLTGEFVTDASTASRSLVTRLRDVEYDHELLQWFGLENEALPRIVANDEIVGNTEAFGHSVPVTGLVVDQQAALLAEACLEPGDAKCTFGTGAFLLANVGAQGVASMHGLTVSAAWQTRFGTTYCSDGQVFTAASAVRWLQDVGLLSGPEEIDHIAQDDANGVRCVPALAGLAAPWWRSDASATFDGLTLSSTRGDIVTSVLQGIAAQVAAVVDLVALDLGRPLRRLRVDGGLTRSRTFMQAVANLVQLPVEVYPSPHATPLGAVALARMALDPGRSLADAVVAWQPATTFEPAWSPDRAAEFRQGWLALVEQGLGQR